MMKTKAYYPNSPDGIILVDYKPIALYSRNFRADFMTLFQHLLTE